VDRLTRLHLAARVVLRYIGIPLTPNGSNSNDEQAAVSVEAQQAGPAAGRSVGLLPELVAGFAVNHTDVPKLSRTDRSQSQSLPSLQDCDEISGWRVGLLQNLVPNFMPVSFVLLTANFVFFLVIFAAERDLSAQDLGRLVWGVRSPSLARWGANMGALVLAGQWWRLVSAIFIHIGIIHLAFNSYALIFIGPLLEELLGGNASCSYTSSPGVQFVVSNRYYGPWLTTAGLPARSSG
jgi:membrane associated rhomboid family serine protease